MFSPRKPAYAYNSPPVPRPAPPFPFASKPSFRPNKPSARAFQSHTTTPATPFGSPPSSPPKIHPVYGNIFGDPTYTPNRAGLGFHPAPSASPSSASASTHAEAPGLSTSPLRNGSRIHPALGLSPAERAKAKAHRAHAAARISNAFHKAHRSARHREENKPKTLDDEFKKRMEKEEARKLYEEICMRAELDKERLAEEEHKKAASNRWTTYLAQWERIMKVPANPSEHELLTARHLPCPMFNLPSPNIGVNGIDRAGIESFIMDPTHSEGKNRRERVRAALLMWHPDKLEKWICKFREDRHPLIREVAGVVTRHLTDMMTV
ncbi:hypothetical protein FRC07_007489 [Ceratobasidium sp. 392]|nr:hypothetical protein FRC07_007489 [Ceratobasidium sp. 392]